ncbi:ATP-binding protein [Planctomycetota bacterium]
MIERYKLITSIHDVLEVNPTVVLSGPRQCGKTTIARIIAGQRQSEYFDLEDPIDLARLEPPMTMLKSLKGLVVIDEVQRKPELFEILRVLADRPDSNTKFLLLGSASFQLNKAVSETLAGRVGLIDMGGFDLGEIGYENFQKLWIKGSFPRSYLAPSEKVSYKWRSDFTRTFLERDIPQLGITIPAQTLRRFWIMIAHYHGQIWNAAEFARSLGRGEKAARHYLDILTGSYMVRQLQPWHENIKKRQVKSPKIYIRDSGLLHCLLSLENSKSVFSHPKLGASWEGFCIEQVLSILEIEEQAWFWATHSGAEVDLMVFRGGKRLGFEFKYTDAPKLSKSIHIAIDNLGLDHLYVIYPGEKDFMMADNVYALPITQLHKIAGI